MASNQRKPAKNLPPAPGFGGGLRTALFWAALLALFFIVYYQVSGRREREIGITYSQFKEELNGSNIREVTFLDRAVK
ncbi:MAG: hypothetical protein QME74_10860, partial [Candidatus Edwardsbacteria bacterium]|nr:hypothetical protein [Candidatus Edwardsbacteria bacterium]